MKTTEIFKLSHGWGLGRRKRGKKFCGTFAPNTYNKAWKNTCKLLYNQNIKKRFIIYLRYIDPVHHT